MHSVPTAVFFGAHPDDQFLQEAGTAAYLVEQGWRVVFDFKTRGENGQTSGLCQPKELAAVRMGEERHSSKILGVSHVNIKNFGDGHLPQKKDLLVADIKKVLKEEQPQRVYTFPPSGCTGHEDHKTIQQATLEAVREYSAEGAQVELYYRVIPKDSLGIVDVESDLEYEVTDEVYVVPYWMKMYGAMMAHRTQRKSMATIFPALERGWWELWPYEYFHAVMLN